MRYFIASYTIRTGDEEYHCSLLHAQDNEYTDLEFVKDWSGSDDKEAKRELKEYEEEGFFWIDDVRGIKFFSIREITEKEHDFLRRFI